MAMGDLHRASYTGQFGFLVIDGRNDPGAYDQEVFLALREWEPYFTAQMADADAIGPRWPQPERPDVADLSPNGLEVSAAFYSVNDKGLGAGEPIRVRTGQRVLFHLLNAGAIENRSIALPGHQFYVLALDGNAVPVPQAVEQIVLGPGERVDAYVDMNRPGVWIMGAVEDNVRNAGLGVVVEYAGQRQPPQWIPPGRSPWDYTVFGASQPGIPSPMRGPADTLEMVFEKDAERTRTNSTAFWSTARRIRTAMNSCCTKAGATSSSFAIARTTRTSAAFTSASLRGSPRSTARSRPGS
jgi:FtsP/CotA-like multicopper oxidase with cupredoxin domain